MKHITTNPGDSSFKYSSPNNFVVIWDGATFGIADGWPFTSIKFNGATPAQTKALEKDWLRHEIHFIEAILEKVKIYAEAINK